MPNVFKIDDFRPGDQITHCGEIKVVLAKLDEYVLLCTDGDLAHLGSIKRLESVNLDTDQLDIDMAAYYGLLKRGLVSPKITELSVGDVVLTLFSGNKVKISTVAVIDRPNGFVFGKDGELLPWGRGEMALTGWRQSTDKDGFLTEKGREEMHQMYE